ncbi:MAG: MCE family protein [Oxalobacter sp.]|nr:MCE family protein [Oxalobacter sp.]
MENRSHAIATLLFTSILGAVIIFLFLYFGHDKSEYVPYKIVTEHPVGSLNRGGKVKLNGIAIGKVTDLGFSKETPGMIAISMEVKRDAPITKGTTAAIDYQPVTGISSIALTSSSENTEKLATSEDSPGLIPMTGGAYRTVTTRGIQIIREVNEVTRALATLLDGHHNKLIFATIKDLSRRSKDWAEAPWYIYAASVDAPRKLHEGHETVKTLSQLAVDVKKVSEMADKLITEKLKSDDIEHLEKIASDSRATLNSINRFMGEYRRGMNSPLIRREMTKGPGE